MRIKSKRFISLVLSLLLIFSIVLDDTSVILAGYVGQGLGGGIATTRGAGTGKWQRTILGGGYIVTFVKYNMGNDNTHASAISSSDLNVAYKDSILVYRSSWNNIQNKKFCIDIAITAGENGGDIINKDWSTTTKALSVAAVKYDDPKAKALLGLKMKFGKSLGNHVYDMNYDTKLNDIYGEGGTRDLRVTKNREKVFDAVEHIYGKKCTLGGINRKTWVNNEAGDGCAYALLIVPVMLVADDTSVSATKCIACYPAEDIADKVPFLSKSQFTNTLGGYDDTYKKLKQIKGENQSHNKIFNGYVPYGGNIPNSGIKVVANVAAFIDTGFYNGLGGYHEGVDDVVYSIIGATSSKSMNDALNLNDRKNIIETTAMIGIRPIHTYGISYNVDLDNQYYTDYDTKYIYQDSYYRFEDEAFMMSNRLLSNPMKLDYTKIGGIKSYSDDYKFIAGDLSLINCDERFALYNNKASDLDSLNNIFDNFSSNVAFGYDTFPVPSISDNGDANSSISAGYYESLKIADADNLPDDWYQQDDEELESEESEDLNDSILDDWIDDDEEDDQIYLDDDEGTTVSIMSVKNYNSDSSLSNSNEEKVKVSTNVGEVKASVGDTEDGDNIIYRSLSKAILNKFDKFKKYDLNLDESGRFTCKATNMSKQEISSFYMGKSLEKASSYSNIYQTDSKKKDYTKKTTSIEPNNFGVSVQVYAKAPTVKSYLKTYDIKVDENGNYPQITKTKSYSSDEYTNMSYDTIEYDFLTDSFDNQSQSDAVGTTRKELVGLYYFINKNSDRFGHSVDFSPENNLYGNIASYSTWYNTIVQSQIHDWGDSEWIFGTDRQGEQMYETYPVVGSTTGNDYELNGEEYGGDIDGFTVYVVRVYTESIIEEEPELESTRVLEDYELSHVWDSLYSEDVIKTTNSHSYKKIGSSKHWIPGDPGYWCPHDIWGPDFRRYIWLNTEKISGARSISSKFKHTGDWWTYVRIPEYDKNVLKTFSEATLVRNNNQLVDEEILITRDMGNGDSVVPSSISKQANNTVDEFISDVLKMTKANKPVDDIPTGSIRNSGFRLTYATDLFRFRGGWVESPDSETHDHSYKLTPSCPGFYNRIPDTAKTLTVRNKISNKIKLTLNEEIYKYITDDIDTGKNSEKAVRNKNIEAPDSGSITGVLRKKYAFPMVKNNKIYSGNSETTNPVLTKFYSEVEMIAEIPTKGEEYVGDPSRYKVWMMNEKLRKVENSSLYFVSAESHNDNAIDRANTKLYSDNSTSNRNGTNGTPILYSGADVDLAVKMNIDIDTFGYSLDLINKDEIPEGLSSYKAVIDDRSDIMTDWGNTSNKTNLLKSFQTFSTDIFNSIDADIILEDNLDGGTSNIKKYGNFSTSLGKYAERSSKAKEDGVYQIVIKHGKLVDSNPSYQEMLKQLAKDYYGDVSMTSEADSLFKASKIYKTIADAIEYDGASVNNSQKHDVTDSSIKLGNDNHWYDEQVKTFVIRRYTDSARFRDVTLSDKLDYNMGNTSNGRNDATQNSYNNSNCKWYLYLYYNKKHASDYMKNIITDWYDPSKDATRQTAINSSTILVNHLYIPSVDFRIASDTAAN